MFEETALPKTSNRILGVFITGESITNMNNSRIFEKFEIISGRPYWDQENLFDEKNEMKKPETLSL
jgi:hypothetical protein